VAGAFPHLGLILLHPKNFGRRKTRERVIASGLDQSLLAQPAADLVTLRTRALVVPQDGRAQHLPILVQQHEAVHLPCQPDAVHVVCLYAGRSQHLAHAVCSPIPPETRVLLAPQGPRGFVTIFRGGHGDHVALFVN
jgi:hypothetical protein